MTELRYSEYLKIYARVHEKKKKTQKSSIHSHGY